ncbi:hypothetical protein [Pseudomonas phage D6]|nr:hypothetical protein [Pseudomonas phage D6]
MLSVNDTPITVAHAGDTLELVLNAGGDIIEVKNSQGTYFYTSKDKVNGL